MCYRIKHASAKGIRIYHPKVCHFGMRIILSWRPLRNSRHKRNSLPSPFLSKGRAYISICKDISLSHTRKRRMTRSPEMTFNTGDSTNWSLHKQTLLKRPLSSINFPIYLPSHNLLPLESQILLTLSSHFSTIYHPFLKWYTSSHWFFKKILKIDKYLARLTKKKRERTQIKSEMKGKTLALIPQKYKGS